MFAESDDASVDFLSRGSDPAVPVSASRSAHRSAPAEEPFPFALSCSLTAPPFPPEALEAAVALAAAVPPAAAAAVAAEPESRPIPQGETDLRPARGPRELDADIRLPLERRAARANSQAAAPAAPTTPEEPESQAEARPISHSCGRMLQPLELNASRTCY